MIDFFSEPEPSDLILQKRCPINFFQNFSGKPSRTHSCLDYTQGVVHGCRTVLRTSLARSISLNVPFRTATLERKYLTSSKYIWLRSYLPNFFRTSSLSLVRSHTVFSFQSHSKVPLLPTIWQWRVYAFWR